MPALPFRQIPIAGLLVAALSIPFFAIPSSLAAQSALSIAPQQCVWKQGDDIRWAALDIDESGWQPAATWRAIATPTPNFWLRCHFDPGQLAAAVDPQLQVSGDLAWQVFANGRSVGASGNIATGTHTAGLDIDYPAPEFSRRDQPVVVALRMTFTPNIDGEQSLPQVFLGDAEFQHNAYLSNVYQRTQAQWITWACYALIASAGLFFLMLFWFDRTQRYVLWISLTWLSLADLRINEFLLSASVHYPSFVEFLLYSLGQGVPVFVILFYFALNQRPVPHVFKMLIGINSYFWLALVVAAFLPLRASMALRWATEVNGWMSTIEVLATLAALLSVLVAFSPLRALRGSQIPLASVCLIWTSMDFTYVFVQFPFLGLDITGFFLRIQPYRSLAIAVVVVSMTLLLVQCIRSTNQERAELHGEMASAREIQQYLIPEKLPPTPGLSIHSVYQPSREVGGDFFQVLPDARDGSTLIVVGDVAGKGLKAGMLAALIVGAIRTAFTFTSDPGRILALLNDRLQGRGLVTCLAMRIDRSGSVELANAGHLPPYINGKELALDGALPLGALPHNSFPANRIQLREGDLALLVSDGVVEARNASGELFGFERTARLSAEPVETIARAAQDFGQEDDITVLTLKVISAFPAGTPTGEPVTIPTPV
jgi:Stage II sporulation protein E (SpoIIE)